MSFEGVCDCERHHYTTLGVREESRRTERLNRHPVLNRSLMTFPDEVYFAIAVTAGSV